MWLRRAARPLEPALARLRAYMGAPLEARIDRISERLDRLAAAVGGETPAPAEPPAPVLFPFDHAPANRLAASWSDADVRRLWDHVAATWSRLGSEQPFISVAPADEYRVEGFEPNAERFFASSQNDIERMYRWFERNRRELPTAGTLVEYGCGVGRSTPSLARKFARVKALDISPPHLDIARRTVRAAGLSNVELVHVARRETLEALEGCDLFYSCIVLQHNPPPLISEILERALRGLNPGGFAFFQVPTYGKDYAFDLDGYIASLPPGNAGAAMMEMHVLPQQAVFRIVADAGCSLLEVQPDYCVGSYDQWLSNTFLVEKCSVGKRA